MLKYLLPIFQIQLTILCVLSLCHISVPIRVTLDCRALHYKSEVRGHCPKFLVPGAFDQGIYMHDEKIAGDKTCHHLAG